MGRNYLFIVFILFLSTLSAFSQSAEEYYDMAKKVYPNYEKAVFYITKAIYKEPKNADWYLARAKVNFISGLNKDSETKRDLTKAQELAPGNPHIYCWLSRCLPDKDLNESKFTLNEIYNLGKDKPEILNYYIHAASRYKKSFKFENSEEITKLYQKAPKTYRNMMNHIKFLELEGKKIDANKVYSELLKMPYSQLIADYDKKHILNKNDVPLSSSGISFISSVGIKTVPHQNQGLIVRHLDEQFLQYQFQKISFSRALQDRYPTPLVSYDHIKALYTVGRYLDVIKYAKQKSEAYARRLNYPFVAKSYSNMGLHKEAAQIYESLVKGDNYLSEKTFSLIKELVKDQQYDKALKIASTLKLKSIPDDIVKRQLSCTYYVTTQQFGAWEKHYKDLKKFHGTSNYHEIMHQVNVVRTTCGNPHLSIYQKNKKNTPHNQLEMLFTEANAAQFKKKLPQAQELLKTAKSLTPDDSRHIYQEALYLFRTEENEKALTAVNELLNHSPNHEKGIILKGMIQINQQDFKGAYASFSLLANKRTSNFYKLIPLFCLGKFNTIQAACEKLIKQDVDARVFSIYHMLKARSDKETADKVLKENMNKFKTASTITYANYKLGKDNFKSYSDQLNYGPILSPNFNFTIGFDAMQKGEKEKALKHFKKCLTPYSIDLPEYHMAKACIKMLEK